jgi:hypothetical protein
MLSKSVPLPLDIVLYFVQQLPADYQKAIFDFLLVAQQQASNEPKQENWQPLPLKRGAGKHLIGFIADDFNAPMEDFKEYM